MISTPRILQFTALIALIALPRLGAADYLFESDRLDDGSRRALGINASQSGLRVLWWNVEHGLTNQSIHEHTGVRALDHNILELTEDASAPHVMTFGEYSPDTFQPETLEILRRRYPYFIYRGYGRNPDFDCGMAVFSKVPLDIEQDRPLSWVPFGQRSARSYRRWWAEHDPHGDVPLFDRTFFQIRVRRELSFESNPIFRRFSVPTDRRPSGPAMYRDVRIVPVHLANPWVATMALFEEGNHEQLSLERARRVGLDFGSDHLILGRWAGSSWLGHYMGRGLTAQLILAGRNHPIAWQLRRIHRWLYFHNTQERPNFFNEEAVLMMGDFNMPTFEPAGIIEVVPPTLQWFDSYLPRVFTGSESTYPTPSGVRAKELAGEAVGGSYKIDHAMASHGTPVSFRAILPLQGSDHYPLYIIIDDSNPE